MQLFHFADLFLVHCRGVYTAATTSFVHLQLIPDQHCPEEQHKAPHSQRATVRIKDTRPEDHTHVDRSCGIGPRVPDAGSYCSPLQRLSQGNSEE